MLIKVQYKEHGISIKGGKSSLWRCRKCKDVFFPNPSSSDVYFRLDVGPICLMWLGNIAGIGSVMGYVGNQIVEHIITLKNAHANLQDFQDIMESTDFES